VTTLGVLVFVVGLLLSIMLHELGHFATAKHYGMKATRFFLGFGPTLWSVRRGETEYGVKALPAGGFVKIVGMTELEEIEPGDENRAMWRFPARQRAVVLAAGSFMHFVIAGLLCFGILVTVGDVTAPRETLTVAGVAKCLPAKPTVARCAPGDPAAPAYGKLHAGDQITAVDGHAISSFQPLQRKLRASVGVPVLLTVIHHGVTRQVSVTPAPYHEHGKVLGKIGIGPEYTNENVSVLGAVPRTFGQFGLLFKATAQRIARLPGEVPKVLHGEARTANDPGSVVDIARVSGSIASSTSVPLSDRVANLLFLLAEVNFFVGVFNLLPLLPLDGGHLAILGFEKARGALYRVLGRRDPGRVDLLKIMPVTYAVVAVFVSMSLLLLYAGIANPIKVQ
jgi:membrane-associated protease RseP (regulator of RpoE activity)